MNIETYLNGILIGTTQISEPQIENWQGIKIGFLANTGYQRITTQTTNVLAVTRLETAVIDYVGGMEPTYSLFKLFWDSIIDGLIVKPTVLEIASWNTLCTLNFMKFNFGVDGKIIITGG